MGRYDLDEYDEYEDEGEDQEENVGEDEEEEEDHQPTQEELKYLNMRQKLKESIRKKRKKDSISGLANSQEKKNKMPYDNFGSFFGPSQPVIAQRVIQESKSLLENPHLVAKVSKAKNVQHKGGASTPVVSRPQSRQQPREVINLAKPKAKIQMLRNTRDYSFLSEDADLPAPKKNPHKSMPTPKPEVHEHHSSQRKPSNTGGRVINGGEKRKPLPKVSQTEVNAALSTAKLNSTSLQPRKQLGKNDRNGPAPARPSAPKGLSLKPPVASKEKASLKPHHSKPPPLAHKKPVAQKRDERESKKPILSSKPQIKKHPPKRPTSVQQMERLKKRPVRSYLDDEEDGDKAISMIRSMFRYNPSRYGGVNDDDDSDMEAGFDDIMMEEKRSARIAAKEDEEELRKIEEEEKRERMRKAAKKRKLSQR